MFDTARDRTFDDAEDDNTEPGMPGDQEMGDDLDSDPDDEDEEDEDEDEPEEENDDEDFE